MKFYACFVAAGVAVGSLGCSSGDDVYIRSDTTTSQSSLSCTLAAGEDVCLRSWDDIGPNRRADAIALLNAAAEFSGEAHELADELARACEEILTKLDVAMPSIASDATDSVQVDTVCGVAVASIQQRRSTALTLEGEPSSCTGAAPPACVPSGSPRVQCVLPIVKLVADEKAPDSDRALAASIEGSFAYVVNVKYRLESLVDAAAALASSAADGKALGLPECLQTTVSSLVETANDDVHHSLLTQAKLLASLDTPAVSD